MHAPARRQTWRNLCRTSVVPLAAAICLSSCDAPELTAPSPSSLAARPRGELTTPMPLGSGSVTPPGSTLPNAVISPPQATITTIPESTWVVVTVSGQLTFTRNPGCDLITGDWKCEAKVPTLNFEAAPSTGGPLHLWVQEGVQRSWVGLRGSGGEANSPGSAIGLVREATAGTLQGEMVVFQAWSYNPFSGGSEPTYYIGGGYNVTATAVPSPLKLTETPADSEGTRTYTVEPLYGLIFMNPTGDNRPAGAVTWYWIPGDSVSSTPGWSEYNEWIQDCQFQTTCRFKAPGPGKVQAYASVERRGVAIRSSGGAPQCQAPAGPLGTRGPRADVSASDDCSGPKVVLTCTGDIGKSLVTRGQELRCEVTKDPASTPGEIRVQKWAFAGRQRTDGDATSTTWTGPMASGGNVEVWAQIGEGETQHRSATITVQPRVWRDPLPPLQRIRCPAVGVDNCPLSSPLVYDKDLGVTQLFPDSSATIPEKTIDVGPNTGWSYVPGSNPPLRFSAFVTFLNSELYDTHSNFYKHSNCRMAEYVPKVEEHESFHATRAQTYAADGYLNMKIEGFVRQMPPNSFHHELAVLLAQHSGAWLAEMVDRYHLSVPLIDNGCHTGLLPNPR